MSQDEKLSRAAIAKAISPGSFRDGDVAGIRANQRASAFLAADRVLAILAGRDEALLDVRDHALAFVNAYDNPDGPALVRLDELRASLSRAALPPETPHAE